VANGSESIESLERQSRILSGRLASVEECCHTLKESICCTRCGSALDAVLSECSKVTSFLEAQKEIIELLLLKESQVYTYNDLLPLLSGERTLRSTQRVVAEIYQHIYCPRNLGKQAHVLQKVLDEAAKTLNNLERYQRNFTRSVVPITLVSGAVPHQIPNMLDIVVVGIPVSDLGYVLSWPCLGHEMVHGFYRHRRKKRNEFKADYWATVVFGPSYLLSFYYMYGGLPGHAKREFVPKGADTHPYPENRLTFCIDVLRDFMGYKREITEKLRKAIRPLFYYDPENGGTSGKEVDKDEKSLISEILGSYKSIGEERLRLVERHSFCSDRFSSRKVQRAIYSQKDAKKCTPIEILNSFVWESLIRRRIDPFDNKANRMASKSIAWSRL